MSTPSIMSHGPRHKVAMPLHQGLRHLTIKLPFLITIWTVHILEVSRQVVAPSSEPLACSDWRRRQAGSDNVPSRGTR